MRRPAAEGREDAMQGLRTDVRADALSPTAIGRLIQSLGTREFDCEFRRFVLGHVGYDHLTAFHFAFDSHTPHPTVSSLLAFSENGTCIATDATHCYLERHWSKDPMLPLFRRAAGTAETRFRRMQVGELPDRVYRRDCYDVDDILQRFSMVSPSPDGSVVINLYRCAYSRGFDEDELRTLRLLGEISGRALGRQRCFLAQLEAEGDEDPLLRAFHERLKGRNVRLSRRERDVCAGLLVGATAAGIASDLGICESSVITYRRRAYQKLGVADRFDLVAFAIGQR